MAHIAVGTPVVAVAVAAAVVVAVTVAVAVAVSAHTDDHIGSTISPGSKSPPIRFHVFMRHGEADNSIAA